MVRQQRRTDRSSDPAAGGGVPRVRFPERSSGTTAEERGDPGAAGGSGETKRPRLEGGTEEAPTNREKVPGSCDQPESCSPADGVSCRASPPDQQGAAEEHMAGSEHLKKLKEMTHSISLNTHTLQERGRRPDSQIWCDACQTHFSDDVIVHRRTKQHKVGNSTDDIHGTAGSDWTPRKFVEHMKSAEHKEQETQEYDPQTIYGSSFVLPVSGFLCRLCNKFFFSETTSVTGEDPPS
ncbi:Cip1-interacting zinc finger protein [Dissostichus eleginoides]|uniref:Cip1-interacting zinc finger protein n=1 Tax=Dissostichus eleginoides TaxID=100907 RepID=A0AAD9BYK4_DISEL|nr:Cip1-interacting zinc finger protein [Dissostichus eleginoides]